MHTVTVQGVRVPWILYGTAWKEDRTTDLVVEAIKAGFRAIDTANQRKHYVEADVGRALALAGEPRDHLFVQTKFTFVADQDHRLPYERDAPVPEQVAQSCASSCRHLGVERLDAVLLHGPQEARGLTADDRAAWTALEELHRRGLIGLLGLSNVTVEQLELLVEHAAIAPALVQNRCYARTGWDREVRAWCLDHGARYQGFSLLTANQAELSAPAVAAIAKRHGRSVPEVVFAFARQSGILVLTGTTDRAHMRADLSAAQLVLEPLEVRTLLEGS